MSVESRTIRFSPTGKFIAIAIIVALAILLIRALGGVLTPFVAAAITAYLFNPLITFLNRRTRVGRAAWILVLYGVLGVLFYWLVRVLGPIISSQYRELLAQAPEIARTISNWLGSESRIDLGGLVIDTSPVRDSVVDFLNETARSFSSTVPHLFASAIESLLLFMTYLIVTFYFLQQAEQISSSTYGLVPAPFRAEIRELGRQIDEILSSYVRGTLLLIPIMAILTYIMLTILGVHYALVIAITTGFLEIIPLIGPWSAALIAMTVALFQATTPFGWDHWVLAAVVGVSYFVLRMSEDNFIIPHVVGHAVHLHPVLVLFAILAGGVLGGAFGLLVSIPVVAVVRLLLRYIYRKLIDDPELPPPDLRPAQPTHPTLPRPEPPKLATQSLESPVAPREASQL